MNNVPAGPAPVAGQPAALPTIAKALMDTSHPYYELARVLNDAFIQASRGKGKERHANNLPFTEQKIQKISEGIGSVDGLIYQVCKKSMESKSLLYPRNNNELLGAIVYAAAAVIFNDNERARQEMKDELFR